MIKISIILVNKFIAELFSSNSQKILKVDSGLSADCLFLGLLKDYSTDIISIEVKRFLGLSFDGLDFVVLLFFPCC
jgi:hypothetical protein